MAKMAFRLPPAASVIDNPSPEEAKELAARMPNARPTRYGNLNAQTASGDVTVATAVNGGVSAQTSSGEVVVGIAEGTSAELDLRTRSGEVRNLLTPSDGPAVGDETLVVHARTGSGDVIIQRATADAMP